MLLICPFVVQQVSTLENKLVLLLLVVQQHIYDIYMTGKLVK